MLFGFMTTRIHTYDEVFLLNLRIRGDGSIYRNDPIMYHKREVINKMACYHPYDGWDLVRELYDATDAESINPGSKVYVASECTIGRDTLRNSGYSITRDPAKADAIIVPDVKAEKYARIPCNFIATDSDNLYLVTVEISGYDKANLTVTDTENVKKYLKEAMSLTVEDTTETKIDVWFIPKCEELKDIMEEHIFNVPYVQESRFPINASTTFSPETLVFWENIDDKNLLIRTICTSDWNKYPITLLVFLAATANTDNNSNWYNSANGDFRRILQSIGYQAWSSVGYLLEGRSISPEDYDMLQSYLYYKMGADANGGFVDAAVYNKAVPREIRPLLQRKIAVKPMHIPAKMKLSAIMGK